MRQSSSTLFHPAVCSASGAGDDDQVEDTRRAFALYALCLPSRRADYLLAREKTASLREYLIFDVYRRDARRPAYSRTVRQTLSGFPVAGIRVANHRHVRRSAIERALAAISVIVSKPRSGYPPRSRRFRSRSCRPHRSRRSPRALLAGSRTRTVRTITWVSLSISRRRCSRCTTCIVRNLEFGPSAAASKTMRRPARRAGSPDRARLEHRSRR